MSADTQNRAYLPAESVPLGLVPPPLDDEPLDGYLEYLAHRLCIPRKNLLNHLGLTTGTSLGAAAGLSPDAMRRMCSSTAWTPEQVSAMTLQRFAGRGVHPPAAQPGGGAGLWLRRRGVRYCPQCLRERDLRWRLSWYVQWTFVCVRHNVLLHNACPQCGRPPRTRPAGHPRSGAALWHTPRAHERSEGTRARTPTQPSCCCPVEGLASADSTRYVHEPVLEARAPRGVVEAQRLINGRLVETEPSIYLGNQRSTVEWFQDLAALTRMLLVHHPVDHIPNAFRDLILRDDGAADHSTRTLDAKEAATASVGTSRDAEFNRRTLDDWEQHLGLNPITTPPARFTEAGNSRVAFAVAASAAAYVLGSDDCAAASRLLACMLPGDVRKEAVNRSRSRGISWPLAQALWLTDNPARPSQLRAIRLGSDQFRLDGTERPPLDPARLPARPWTGVRSTLTWTRRDPYTGLATSAALLMIAGARSASQACAAVGYDHLSLRVATEIRGLFGSLAAERDVFDDLLALHDAVTSTPIPIDYERRRRVFPDPQPIAERTVHKIARDLGQRHTARLARFMSWWVHEQLTGSDPLLRPDFLDLPGPIRLAYAKQRNTWETTRPALLLRRAEHALLVNRIDEPITWTPTLRPGGAWSCPPPETVRQLDWSNRPTRQASHTDTAAVRLDLAAMDPKGLVAFARSGQSGTSERLATLLTRFAEVAAVGTITGAARNLGIRQPTLSVAMRNLEDLLEASLLDRSHHAITVTSRGREIVHVLHANPIAPGCRRDAQASGRGVSIGRSSTNPRVAS